MVSGNSKNGVKTTTHHGLATMAFDCQEPGQDSILNNSKLFQMESPSESSLGGDISAGNSGATNQVENSNEDSDQQSDNEDTEVPIP